LADKEAEKEKEKEEKARNKGKSKVDRETAIPTSSTVDQNSALQDGTRSG